MGVEGALGFHEPLFGLNAEDGILGGLPDELEFGPGVSVVLNGQGFLRGHFKIIILEGHLDFLARERQLDGLDFGPHLNDEIVFIIDGVSDLVAEGLQVGGKNGDWEARRLVGTNDLGLLIRGAQLGNIHKELHHDGLRVQILNPEGLSHRGVHKNGAELHLGGAGLDVLEFGPGEVGLDIELLLGQLGGGPQECSHFL